MVADDIGLWASNNWSFPYWNRDTYTVDYYQPTIVALADNTTMMEDSVSWLWLAAIESNNNPDWKMLYDRAQAVPKTNASGYGFMDETWAAYVTVSVHAPVPANIDRWWYNSWDFAKYGLLQKGYPSAMAPPFFINRLLTDCDFSRWGYDKNFQWCFQPGVHADLVAYPLINKPPLLWQGNPLVFPPN